MNKTASLKVNKKLRILSEMFPVSSEVFGDAAIDAMGSAHEILAKSSLNIEKHAQFEEELVFLSYFYNITIREHWTTGNVQVPNRSYSWVCKQKSLMVNKYDKDWFLSDVLYKP